MREEPASLDISKDPMDKMYTVAYVAEMFAVSKETVRLWIKQQKLDAVRINGYWRVPRSALMTFANHKFGTPKAEAV